MSKVIVSGYIDFGDKDVAPILEAARDMIAVTYEEEGCIHYVWTKDVLKPGRMWVYEEWVSVETLAAHLVHANYYDMGQHLVASGMTGADVRKYLVDRDEPIYDGSGIARAEFTGAN